MATYLFKTEPSEFSFADLQREKKARWDGITNAQAINFLREAKKGDEVLFYHTGDEKAVVGLAQITGAPHPDPDQPGLDGQGRPKFIVVDIKPVKAAKTPVTLATIKADKRFVEFLLVKNSRLSVMPVPPALDKLLREKAGL
jgi:predicted RNA-binding protein with PUA-like domain